jgi:hypothetical protein
MSSRQCKRCPYSALCYVTTNGWQRVFTQLFWEAGKHVGLFGIVGRKLMVPTETEAFKARATMAEEHMRKELVPQGCPHSKESYVIRPVIDGQRVDVELEFPR